MSCFLLSLCIRLWQAGLEDILMWSHFPQRWHRGPVSMFLAAFHFPSLASHTPSCQLCSPELLAKLPQWWASVFSSLWHQGAFVCFFVCPVMKRGQHYLTLSNSRIACSFKIKLSGKIHHSATRWSFYSCQLSHQKSTKFAFSFCSIWKNCLKYVWQLNGMTSYHNI